MGAFNEYKSVTGSVQYTEDPASAGGVTQPATGEIIVKHVQFGPFCQTTLKLVNVPQAVVNGTEYQSTKIFDLPDGRINVLGCVATLQQKTTSAIASTLNASVTGAIAIGTVAASNVSPSVA